MVSTVFPVSSGLPSDPPLKARESSDFLCLSFRAGGKKQLSLARLWAEEKETSVWLLLFVGAEVTGQKKFELISLDQNDESLCRRTNCSLHSTIG